MRSFHSALAVIVVAFATQVLFAAAPTISSVVPNRGPTSGGTQVTIRGSNFTGTTSVQFGGVNATSFTVLSDGAINAVTAPRDMQGLVDVRVANPDGAATLTNAFAYVQGPIARDDAYATPFNVQKTEGPPGVLTNDLPAEGGPLIALLESAPARGLVSLFRDGSFTYTPSTGFAGTDSFTYRASNDIGLSNVATVTLTVVGPTAPQNPSGLAIWSVIGTLVTLRWTPPSLGPTPTGNVVECGAAPGQTTVGYSTSGTTPAFTFQPPLATMYCRVFALSDTQRSGASNEVTVFVDTQTIVPSAPQDFAAVVNGSTVGLSWRNTFTGGTPVSIVVDVAGSITASIPLGLTETFNFSGVPAGTYTVTLRAVNAAGSSTASNSVTLTFPGTCAGAPPAPPDFLAYKVGTTIYVVWGPPPAGAPAATSYVLNVTGSFVGGFATTSRMLSADAPAGTYNFSVIALNACGFSPATAVQTVTIP